MPVILLTNICHISNKLDELSVLLKVHCPNIFAATESWLNADIPDEAIAMSGRLWLQHFSERSTFWSWGRRYVNVRRLSTSHRR